jgi:nucleotide-binding universal stress UspA family protein
MAISITNLCVVLKDSKSCPDSILIAEKLQNYFKANVDAFLVGNSKIGLPATFNLEENVTIKNIGKKFNASKNELIILPVIKGDSEKGLLTVAEAYHIIEHSERMVLTVPCSGAAFNLSTIVVPIDSSFETRQKVPYAIALARVFNATLHIVGVSNDKGKDSTVLINNYMRQVCNNIEEKGVKFVSESRLGGNPTDMVLAYSNEVNAGMAVIMTEQETNFISFFSGKYSQQMVKNSNIPILSIHPKDLIVSDARL